MEPWCPCHCPWPSVLSAQQRFYVWVERIWQLRFSFGDFTSTSPLGAQQKPHCFVFYTRCLFPAQSPSKSAAGQHQQLVSSCIRHVAHKYALLPLTLGVLCTRTRNSSGNTRNYQQLFHNAWLGIRMMSARKVSFPNTCSYTRAILSILPLSCPFHLGSTACVTFHLLTIWRGMITGE